MIEISHKDPLVIGPDTVSLARRLLLNARVAAEEMPFGFNANEALEILLLLHAAEGEGDHYTTDQLRAPASLSSAITRRWLRLLEERELVEERASLLALTQQGRALVQRMLGRMYDAQQSLG